MQQNQFFASIISSMSSRSHEQRQTHPEIVDLSQDSDDDKEEVVRNRLEVFRQNTEPVLDYYNKQNIVKSIEGLGSIAEVSKKVFERLNII